MTRHVFVCALVAVAVSNGASSMNPLQARTTHSVLPSPSTAQSILNTTTRHREWMNVASGPSPVLAFVVYPERADTAPVVLVFMEMAVIAMTVLYHMRTAWLYQQYQERF